MLNLFTWAKWGTGWVKCLARPSFKPVYLPVTKSVMARVHYPGASTFPYSPFESTVSRIFLFLEAPPTWVFPGVFIIANQRAVVFYRTCVFAGNLRAPANIAVLKKDTRYRAQIRMQAPGNGPLFVAKHYLCWQLWVGEVLSLLSLFCFVIQSVSEALHIRLSFPCIRSPQFLFYSGPKASTYEHWVLNDWPQGKQLVLFPRDPQLPDFIRWGTGYKSVYYGINNTRPIYSERARRALQNP